jgi:hypothetical protein
MPSVICPTCGERVVVREGSVGAAIRCPHCQDSIDGRAPDRDTVRDAPGSPRRKRRSRRRKPRVLLIVGSVLLILFLVCGGCSTLVYFAYYHEIDEPVTAADKEVMVTAEYVATFSDDIQVDPKKDKFKKVRHLDRSREMSYEYGDPEDQNQPVYVNHMVCIERNAKEARDAYAGLDFFTKLGVGKADGVVEIDRNDLWKWGDQSRCVVLHYGGKPYGNMFMGLKGRRYFVIVISGLYFDKAEDIKAFLDPKLLKLDGYDG